MLEKARCGKFGNTSRLTRWISLGIRSMDYPLSLFLRARWHPNTKNNLQGFRKRSICINDPLKMELSLIVICCPPWKKKCSKYYGSEAEAILKYPPGNPIIYSPYQPARNVWNRWFPELPQVGYMVYGCIWIPSLGVFFVAPFSGQDVGDNVPAGCKCKEGKDVIRANVA